MTNLSCHPCLFQNLQDLTALSQNLVPGFRQRVISKT